jgi:hypothetical protein
MPLFQVVIDKQKSGAPAVKTSKKPKDTPIINLSDDKEVFSLSILFFEVSFLSDIPCLIEAECNSQDNTLRNIAENTSFRARVEKRSKKKHEANTSASVTQAQDPPISEVKKKEKKKSKKIRPDHASQDEGKTDESSQLNPDTAETDQNEKKKHRKRKHKQTSSSADDSHVDGSNVNFGENSSPKRQKTIADSHVQVSKAFLLDIPIRFSIFLTSNLCWLAEGDFTLGHHC